MGHLNITEEAIIARAEDQYGALPRLIITAAPSGEGNAAGRPASVTRAPGGAWVEAQVWVEVPGLLPEEEEV